jgi:hypothetical protein
MNVPTHEPTYQGELVLTHAGASLHEDYGPAFVGFVAEVYRAELLPHPEGGLRLKWQRHAYHAGIDIDDMHELSERDGYIPFHKLSKQPTRRVPNDHEDNLSMAAALEFFEQHPELNDFARFRKTPASWWVGPHMDHNSKSGFMIWIQPEADDTQFCGAGLCDSVDEAVRVGKDLFGTEPSRVILEEKYAE